TAASGTLSAGRAEPSKTVAVEGSRGAARETAKVAPAPQSKGLAGRTLGILGFGPVGRELASRARAMRMDVLSWSRGLTPEAARDHNVTFCSWPRDLGRRCDFICVDAGGDDHDELLVDEEFLQSMRPGTPLIHVGSSGAYDETALAEAIRSGRVRAAL